MLHVMAHQKILDFRPGEKRLVGDTEEIRRLAALGKFTILEEVDSVEDDPDEGDPGADGSPPPWTWSPPAQQEATTESADEAPVVTPKPRQKPRRRTTAPKDDLG